MARAGDASHVDVILSIIFHLFCLFLITRIETVLGSGLGCVKFVFDSETIVRDTYSCQQELLTTSESTSSYPLPRRVHTN